MMSSTDSRWSICRICLKNSDQKLYSIFSEEPEKKDLGNIQEKIEQYGGIKIYPQNNLPNKICNRCLLLLKAAHKFRDLCEQSQEQLKQFINPLKEEDDEDSILVSKVEEDDDDSVILHSVSNEVEEYIQREKTNSQSLIESQYDIANAVEEDEDHHEFIYESVNESSQEGIEMTSEDTNSYGDNVHFEYYDTSSDVGQKRKPTSSVTTKNKRAVKRKRSIKTGGEDSYTCDYCGNVYNDKAKYSLHIKMHKNIKPHQCEICSKHFSTTSQLSRHMNSHTGNRPYKCQFCDASFGDPSTKIKHERIHTNERPYKCSVCPKSFSYSNVLKVHMMVHSGEKPHVCAYCDKAFSQVHHKNAHEKRHSKLVVIDAEDLNEEDDDLKDFEMEKD